MKKIILHPENCKGCFLCISACPKKAIRRSGVLGPKGYETVTVDEEKCVHCGSCYRMCPDFVYEIAEE